MNGYSAFGAAFSGIGKNVSEFGDALDQKKAILRKLIADRAQADFENRLRTEAGERARRDDVRQQSKADRDATAEKDQTAFQKTLAAGKPAPAPDGTEIDPSAPDSERPANVPLSRDEVIRKALEAGTLSPEKYIEYTKAKEITPTADIQDYLTAKSQGYNGSFVEFLKTKATATHIDVGGAADIRAAQSERNNIRGLNAADPQVKYYKQISSYGRGMVADYKNYQKTLQSNDQAGVRAHQQAILDKYISISTGKPTTEAQFKSMVDRPQGVANWYDNFRAKYKYGSLLPKAVIDGMVKDGLMTIDAQRSGVRNANEGTATMASQSPFDIKPEGVEVIPEKQLVNDSSFIADSAPQDYPKEWNSHPTFPSLEALKAAHSSAKGAWVNGVHYER